MAEQKRSSNRRYTLRERARRQEETRLRIAEAALQLHSTVGPAATTISAVAELAGVERLTVYRHFPDTDALFMGCTALHFSRDPAPVPATWARIVRPEERLRTALAEVYGYYRRNPQLMANLRRDRDALPTFVAEGLAAVPEEAAKVLAPGWRARGRRRQRLHATLRHAVDFGTWWSLAFDGGLSDDEAVELMVRLARTAASE